jgi:hypothetical protein
MSRHRRAFSGSCGTTLGAGLPTSYCWCRRADVAVVAAGRASASRCPNIDPTRRSGRVTLAGATGDLLAGARGTLVDIARLIVAAEAIGVAGECTTMAAEYAKARIQFGRPIAMYQGIKHHCSNMLVATELATSTVWDAARAATKGGEPFSYAAAAAVALAVPAANLCANLNTQVHGGIGFTWEHDAHLYLRRATALAAIVDPAAAATAVTDLTRKGVKREKSVDLPPEAEIIRAEVRAFADSIKGLDAPAQRARLIESGYVMPHWPAPWGRQAGAIEQLVIEQEFTAAGVQRPQYSITGWVILTLIQNATPDQVSRWVMPALRQDLIWCQLFSEPDAGSDAAAVKTKATRVDGGWLVNGQKVWTKVPTSPAGASTVHQPRRPQDDGINSWHPCAEGTRRAQDERRLGVQRGVLQRRVRARRRRDRAGRRRVDRGPGHPRQRERQHRRRPGRHDAPRRRAHGALRRPSRAARRRRRPDRSLRRDQPGHGPAQPPKRQPGRRR